MITTYTIEAPIQVTLTVTLGEGQTIEDFVEMTDEAATAAGQQLDSKDAGDAIGWWQKLAVLNFFANGEDILEAVQGMTVTATVEPDFFKWNPEVPR